jgi:hypothetical protein
MKKNKTLLLIIISLISITSFAQSLTSKTADELETMKKDAISAENYELANKISDEQKSRISIDDLIKEYNDNLKIAVANENFDEAERLKKEIKRLEDKKVKLAQLEEEKKAAILAEDFDKVLALEKQIGDLKAYKKPTPAATQKTAPTTTQPSVNATNTITNQQMPFANDSQNTLMSVMSSIQQQNGLVTNKKKSGGGAIWAAILIPIAAVLVVLLLLEDEL